MRSIAPRRQRRRRHLPAHRCGSAARRGLSRAQPVRRRGAGRPSRLCRRDRGAVGRRPARYARRRASCVRRCRDQARRARPGRRGDELRSRDVSLRPGGQRQDLPCRAPARAAPGQHRDSARDRRRQRGHPDLRSARSSPDRGEAGACGRARSCRDRRRALDPVPTPGRAVRRRTEARDARSRLRREHALLPGAAARQGEQRHLHRRRPRPAARDAAGPDEPLGRARSTGARTTCRCAPATSSWCRSTS